MPRRCPLRSAPTSAACQLAVAARLSRLRSRTGTATWRVVIDAGPRRWSGALAIVVILGSATLGFSAPAGSLDTTFHCNGRLSARHSRFGDFGYAVAVQPDGAIVVAGAADASLSTGTISVRRYLPDGRLDDTFGIGGIANSPFLHGSARTRVLLQPNGQIVAATTTYLLADNSYHSAMLVTRFNSDGTIDSTFGDGGAAIVAYPSHDTLLSGLTITVDGRIAVSGSTQSTSPSSLVVAVFDGSGKPVVAFGGSGTVLRSLSSGNRPETDIVADKQGRLLAYSEGRVLRLLSDGSDDPTFTDGVVAGGLNGDGAERVNLRLLPDESIIVHRERMVTKFNASGLPDLTFGTDGTLILLGGLASSDYLYDIQVQPDGALVFIGAQQSIRQSGGSLAVVYRTTSAGVPDTTFGSDGRVVVAFDDRPAAAVAGAIDESGRILVAGASFPSVGGDDFFRLGLLRLIGSEKELPSNQADRDGDGICAVEDICTTLNGASVFRSSDARLVLRESAAGRGRTRSRLKLSATFQLPAGIVLSDLDPLMQRARVVVTANDGRVLVDMPLQPERNLGRFGFGWRAAAWRYSDRSSCLFSKYASVVVGEASRKPFRIVRVSVDGLDVGLQNFGPWNLQSVATPLHAAITLAGERGSEIGACGESDFSATGCRLEAKSGGSLILCHAQ